MNCIKSLLPTIADDNVAKFKEYVAEEKVPWVKEFVLYMAATFGSKEFLKVFLEDTSIKFCPVIEFDSVLNFAAGNGKLECLKYLIECGIDVKGVRLETKDTSLHIAAHNGYSDCVKFLLSESRKNPQKRKPLVDVNVRNGNGATPLHCAAHNGKEMCVKILLRNGADVHAKDAWGDIPLHKAVVNGHKQCAKLLIDAKSDINALVSKHLFLGRFRN